MPEFKPDTDYPIDIQGIPSNWIVTSVGDVVADIRQGFGTSKHNSEGRGVPHLRPMNISRDGDIVLNELKYVEVDKPPLVKSGDILFNNTNSAELVGKTALFDKKGSWSFSNHMTRIRPALGISPAYFSYQFLYLFREGYFRQRRTQHIGQASINSRTLMETVPFLLAPTKEQHRIVIEIDRNFERLRLAEDAVKAARSKLRDYEKLVLFSAVDGTLVVSDVPFSPNGTILETAESLLDRLRDANTAVKAGAKADFAGGPKKLAQKELEDLPKLPAGWIWARVEEVGSITLGRQRAPEHHQGENMRPYLRVANVFEDRIDVRDVLQMNFTPAEYGVYRLEHGDILLNEGQSPELVGRPAMFRNEIEGACFQNTLVRFRAYHGVSPGFALLVFRAYLHRGRFREIAQWTTNIAHLGARRFAQLEFPLPPLAEQERIVAEANRRLQLVQSLNATLSAVLDRIATARNLVLHKAYTGMLAERDPAENAADLLGQIRAEIRKRLDQKTSVREPRTKMPIRKRKARAQLVNVLHDAAAPLTPEELLASSGIGEDMIDEFYSELRTAVDSGHIIEERDGQGQVHLRFVGKSE